MKRLVVLGFGTVGSGVVELVERNREYLNIHYGQELKLEAILVRSPEKHRNQGVDSLLTTSFDDLLAKEPDVAVEAIGGIEPARTYTEALLRRGIDVVTANKDLIAEHGMELMEVGRAHGASVSFEAAVGGGIPVIKPFQESLKGNRIHSIAGIINGTSNFILSKMYAEGLDYQESLQLAQRAGFAEADPAADVLGLDAARKLGILSSIAFDKRIRWQEINTQGIDTVTPSDISNARQIRCKIKPLVLSHRQGREIHCSVRPALVPKNSALGGIDNENNIVQVEGDAVGTVTFTGRGAGKLPTASAVYGDLLDVLLEKTNGVLPLTGDTDFSLNGFYNRRSRWLVRFEVSAMPAAVDYILQTFSGYDLQLHRVNDPENVFFVVETDNEIELHDKLAAMVARDCVRDARCFLIFA